MAMPINVEDLKKLKMFIDFCSSNPKVLNMPQMAFVKEFVEKLGGKIPEGEMNFGGGCPFGGDKAKKQPESMNVEPEEQAGKVGPEEPEIHVEMESDSESEVELDMEGVIEGDKDPDQFMGDETKQPTEEEIDQASELRSQAASAYNEQKFQEAIDLYTKAIELNPGNALFHAKRGQAFLKLKKPNACIRDCDKALELNCDSAASYKFRGRAHRLLGNWELAAKDLRQACKLDFDEEADEWLREVTPNAKKIEQHNIKLERKKAEKELSKRQERMRKAQEANKKAREQTSEKNTGSSESSAGANMNWNDILSSFQDPEIAAALQDIATNPANIGKYKSNPKLLKAINFFKEMGLNYGGPSGQFPTFPGAGRTSTPPPSTTAEPENPKPKPTKPDFVDDGLD